MGIIKRFLILSYTFLCFVVAVAMLFFCYRQNHHSYQSLEKLHLSESTSVATEDKL